MQKIINGSLLSGFVAFILTLWVLFLWHFDSPFPNPLTWDMYEHQTVINEILKGNRAFFPSNLSDTFLFNGYSTLFHLILAFWQKVTGLTPLPFWWIAEKIFFFLTVLVSYLLSWVTTKDRWIAFFSTFLNAFTFESTLAYSPLLLLPQTLAALVWILTFILVIHIRQTGTAKTTKRYTILFFLLLPALLLMHFLVGLVGVATLLLLVTLLLLENKKLGKHSVVDIFLLLSYLSLLLVIVLNPFISVNLLGTPESRYFNLDLLQKYQAFKSWYGLSFWVLLPLGTIFLVFRRKVVEKVLLGLAFLLLGLALFPFSYSLKFYVLARYLTHFMMGAGLAWVISKIKIRALRLASVLIIFFTFTLIFLANSQSFKSILRYQDRATHVSNFDQAATLFLRENYGDQEKVLLMSDPATQGIYEALAKINSPGGVYASQTTRQSLNALLSTKDTSKIRSLVYQIKDETEEETPSTVLLVLSGRTFAWQKATPAEKESITFNVWQPRDLTFTDKEYIGWLKQQRGFAIVFENDGVAIFEVERP